ncbi:MAG TPA: hypothetical protein ENJ97_03095 [Planctomycetes bacterium]|nr:hypothetical protein [Planctomycetota bacterium]
MSPRRGSSSSRSRGSSSSSFSWSTSISISMSSKSSSSSSSSGSSQERRRSSQSSISMRALHLRQMDSFSLSSSSCSRVLYAFPHSLQRMTRAMASPRDDPVSLALSLLLPAERREEKVRLELPSPGKGLQPAQNERKTFSMTSPLFQSPFCPFCFPLKRPSQAGSP